METDFSTDTKEIIEKLPREDGWLTTPLCLWEGYWSLRQHIEGEILAHHFFKLEPTDILVCSPPKCGTTWLKALTFAIVTRTRYNNSTTPLLTKFSHDCMPFVTLDSPRKGDHHDEVRVPGLPLLSTHVPYHCLPKSALDSGCKIVYICREPKDAFVSLYHFIAPKELSVDKALDLFCEGRSPYGPFWDHMLGFWKASRERPENVLFLKYEDMKKDTASNVKRLAEFMGYPFSPDEEKQGAVQNIVELCSFKKMASLEVNKNGTWQRGDVSSKMDTKTFFRKGEVGDWKNFLTPEMAKCVDNVKEDKFNEFGLFFQD